VTRELAPLTVELADGAEVWRDAFAEGFALDPDLTPSQWADEYRWLPRGTGPEPGKWRTDRTPYLREIMDAMGPKHPARRVVVQKGSRTGGTEAANNAIGHRMHLAPCAMLMAMPGGSSAREAFRERIGPMIESSPALTELVFGQTALGVEFPGGRFNITHASSGRSLRARTGALIIGDELDAWPLQIPGEGPPQALFAKRCAGYSNPKEVYITTPTETELSAIEKLFQESDQRRFHLPCPHCGRFDFLTWSGYREHVRRLDGGHYRFVWDEDRPDTVRVACPCGAEIYEEHKYVWLGQGEWRPTAPGDGNTIGFHLPSFLAPLGWIPWKQIADEFVKAAKDKSLLRVWVNQRAGETFEDRISGVRKDELAARLERYPDPTTTQYPDARVPDGVGILVAAVDVQADRLEAKVKGYGAEEESWLIEWRAFDGDPEKDETWHALDAWLMEPRRHASGQLMRIERVCVDSNYKADQVYKFTHERESRILEGGVEQGVYAVRGGREIGKPILAPPTRTNRYRAALFTLCVDTAKETIYARLRIAPPPFGGPGFIHLPQWVDTEYLDQLTAEKSIRVPDKKTRRIVKQWVARRDRNEALDLEVYATAALKMCGEALIRSLAERAARFSVRVEPQEGGTPAAPAPSSMERGLPIVRPPTPTLPGRAQMPWRPSRRWERW
jgi:phage terminase large subunit GpA-like protein